MKKPDFYINGIKIGDITSVEIDKRWVPSKFEPTPINEVFDNLLKTWAPKESTRKPNRKARRRHLQKGFKK